jgi:hypothetical protein
MSQAGALENTSTGGGGANDFVANTGSAVPLAGVVNILGAGGITTSGSGNTITITGGASFKWNVVTSATNPNQIVANNGYICAGVSQVIFILPLVATIGDEFKVASYTATFQINQNGAQQMRIGTEITTAGSGNVASNSAGDAVDMIYVGSNTFLNLDVQGTITVT